MEECDVCYQSFDQPWKVSGYGCCSGRFCRECKGKLTACPQCRAQPPKLNPPEPPPCAVCADPDPDERVKDIACDIYDKVQREDEYLGHELPYCQAHVIDVLNVSGKLGLNAVYVNGSERVRGIQFTPRFGYATCCHCDGKIIGDEYHECPD